LCRNPTAPFADLGGRAGERGREGGEECVVRTFSQGKENALLRLRWVPLSGRGGRANSAFEAKKILHEAGKKRFLPKKEGIFFN